MRIGIDARLLGAAYGMGRYIQLITDEFFSFDKEHEYILFLNPNMAKRYRVPAGANVRVVEAKEPWYSWSEQVTWPWRLRREHLDILWVPQFNVPLLVPCAFVVTVHDMTQWYVPGTLQQRSWVHRAAFRMTFLNAVKRAQTVIAVSDYTKQEIRKHFRVPEEKIHVVHEGPGLLSFQDNNYSQPKTVSTQSPYLLAVSIWRSHKNFVGLLEAFAQLLQREKTPTQTKLVLVGEEDPRYPEVREAITRLSLEGAVITPGAVSDGELDVLYRSAAGFVIPSFYEGFGLTGLEALARGVPVAASSIPALTEVLGPAALYFDPADTQDMANALERLLTDVQERKRLFAVSPSVVSRYSWKTCARTVHTLLTRQEGA